MAEQINMPAGMGGLTRYFEDSESKVRFTPMQVTVTIAALILIELFLHLF